MLTEENTMLQLLAFHIEGCYWQPHTSLCFISWISNVILIYWDWPLKISFIRHESPSSCTLHNCGYERHTFILAKKNDNKIVKMYWGKKESFAQDIDLFISESDLLAEKKTKMRFHGTQEVCYLRWVKRIDSQLSKNKKENKPVREHVR